MVWLFQGLLSMIVLESSIPNRQKDRSSIIKKNPCTISVFQKLWPFISSRMRANAIFLNLALTGLFPADFIKSTDYIIHSLHWLTTWAVLQFLRCLNPQNSSRCAFETASLRPYLNPMLTTGETVSHFELNSKVKQLSRGESLLEN